MNTPSIASFLSQLFQYVARILALFTYGEMVDADYRVSFRRGLSEVFDFLTDETRAEFVLSAMDNIESKIIVMLETQHTHDKYMADTRRLLALSRECVHSFADLTKVLEYVTGSEEYRDLKDHTVGKIELIKFVRQVTGCGLVEAKDAVEADLNKPSDPCA